MECDVKNTESILTKEGLYHLLTKLKGATILESEKLKNIEEFAEKNQNAYSKILTNDLIITASNPTDYSKRFKKVIHLDDYPVYKNINYRRCKEIASESDGEICIEGVYGSVKRRKELLDAIKDKPGKKICIWVNTPKEVCIEREDRDRPEGMILCHASLFEPPTLDEGWDEIIKTEKE